MNISNLENDKLIALKTAHKLSYKNSNTIKSSKHCGCFYCLEIYDTNILTHEDFEEESDGSFTLF